MPEGGGHTSRLKTLVQSLVVAGHHVEVWSEHGLGNVAESLQQAHGEIGGARYEYVLGTTARGTGLGMIGTKWKAVRVMARRLRELNQRGAVDVLWFNHVFFYDMYPLTRLARRLGIRTVQSYEDEYLDLVTTGPKSLTQQIVAWDARLANRYCPPQADAIVAISEYLRDKYARMIGVPAKVHLVPTIVDCGQWAAGDELATDCPVLLYAGTFGEQDEMKMLLDAFVILRKEGQKFRVVMLGGNARGQGPEVLVRRRVAELGLAGIVEMRGFVPLAEVRRQVAQSHILLNIRRDGPWGRSGLSTKLSEYLAAGRLVVTTAIGDVTRYAQDGVSAIVLPVTPTVEEIATAIRRALTEPERRRAIGAAGQAAARRFFDVPVAARMLNEMLTTVVQQ